MTTKKQIEAAQKKLDAAREKADAAREVLEDLEGEIEAGFKKADQMMADREALLREVSDKQKARETQMREWSTLQGDVSVLESEQAALEESYAAER